jgi:hypothetical protein
MGEVKKDCILYQSYPHLKKGFCTGLRDLYCAKEDKPCAFYKSKAEYNRDGTKRKNV